jgi:hypothetical protein
MATSCTVIVGGPEIIGALRDSAGAEGEVLTFTDNEPLKAVEAITSRRPAVVVIERLFAATSRGAALIDRIKADPALAGVEIRVASVDGTYRISPRRNAAPPGHPESRGSAEPTIAELENIVDDTDPPDLPRRPTRSTFAARAGRRGFDWPKAQRRKSTRRSRSSSTCPRMARRSCAPRH